MQHLPPLTKSFVERKNKILAQLSIPDSEYTDASPKGSVDEGIKDLLEVLNRAEGIVSTSSCAGRVSVFLEGSKVAGVSENGQVAAVGGKGAGGAWLFVSHDPVTNGENWIDQLEMTAPSSLQTTSQECRLVHFKFEPMILHILTASPSHAQLVIRSALQAGFRESGAVSLTSSDNELPTPVVAVRSMGLAFESLIGRQIGDRRESFVTPEYLSMLMSIANERFAENTKRIERFRSAFETALSGPAPRRDRDGEDWEDPAARRERKRAEGLRRKAELEADKAKQESIAHNDSDSMQEELLSEI